MEGDLVDRTTVVFCRDVADAARSRRGFRAVQTVTAGPIEFEARVRVHGPAISVEYRRYVSPLVDLEERLTGNAEFLADELVALSFQFDGQVTWLYDATTGTAIEKPYRALSEPLPGVWAVADLGFLRDLPHDFLLRERDTETIDGRPTRVIDLKPRMPLVSGLLRVTSFPIERATVAFDVETLFPSRILVHPAARSSLQALIGSGGVEIRYGDVVEEPAAEPISFAPPEDAHVFREQALGISDLAERAPFEISLGPFASSGFTPVEPGTLTMNDAGDRAHGTILLEGDATPGSANSIVTLRFGNYLARDMARRNTAISEQGDAFEIAGRTVKMLDRQSMWEESLPSAQTADAPIEFAWQEGGVYWFAIGHRLDKAAFRTLIETRVREGSSGEGHDADGSRDA